MVRALRILLVISFAGTGIVALGFSIESGFFLLPCAFLFRRLPQPPAGLYRAGVLLALAAVLISIAVAALARPDGGTALMPAGLLVIAAPASLAGCALCPPGTTTRARRAGLFAAAFLVLFLSLLGIIFVPPFGRQYVVLACLIWGPVAFVAGAIQGSLLQRIAMTHRKVS
jgi:hypothetical protein